nr:hypothetical protein [Chloroflexota bacterium]
VSGSLTAPGAINTHLGYNAAGWVNSVTLKDGSSVMLTYNAQGQRASYSALSATGQTLYSAQFSYSGGALSQASVVSATAGGSVSYTDSYLDGGDGRPIEFTRVQNGATNFYWYEYDGRGDVMSVTDSNGNVVDSYEYDQWGEELTDTSHEALPQRLRAGAMWYDAEMQVQWLWDASSNRYYDPELERYLQPDAPGGSYVFAKDDPFMPGTSGFALTGFDTTGGVLGASPAEDGVHGGAGGGGDEVPPPGGLIGGGGGGGGDGGGSDAGGGAEGGFPVKPSAVQEFPGGGTIDESVATFDANKEERATAEFIAQRFRVYVRAVPRSSGRTPDALIGTRDEVLSGKGEEVEFKSLESVMHYGSRHERRA